MRIWLVSNMYPSQKNPVFGIFVRDSVRELEKRGARTVKTVRYYAAGFLDNLFQYLAFCAKSIRDGFSKKYDLILVHFVKRSGLPASLFRLFRDISLVVNFHGTDLHARGFWKIVTATAVRIADLIIVPSNSYASLLRRRFNVRAAEVVISPSGGIPDYFKRHEHRCISSQAEEVTIGYVSGIRYEKGWSFFLDALKLIEDLPAKAIMIGSGPDFETASKRIKKENLHVELLPAVERRRLAPLYNSFDVMVFPSLRESLGLVGLEAMACGVPVIGSDIDGISEYLRDGQNGLAVEPGSAPSIARALRAFAALSPLERERYAAAAEKTAERFRTDVVMDLLHAKLLSCVERKRRPVAGC